MLLLWLLLVIDTLSQKALIASSSIGYYNYRQTANVMKIHQHLHNNGFNDDDILLMIPENSACCPKNARLGTVSFIDNDYTNINQNMQIDYQHSRMTIRAIIDALTDTQPWYQLNKDRLFWNSKDRKSPMFIYFTGHGGDNYFKVREKEALLKQHFTRAFRAMRIINKQQKYFLISDSCSASTPFQGIDIENITILASSSLEEESKSHGYDSYLNCAKSDDFTFYMDEYLRGKPLSRHNISFKQLYKYMDFGKLSVHAKLISKVKKTGIINQFMQKKQAVLSKKYLSIQQIKQKISIK